MLDLPIPKWWAVTRSFLVAPMASPTRASATDCVVADHREAIEERASTPAYETKYGRRYPTIVPSIVAPQARAATLKLVPR